MVSVIKDNSIHDNELCGTTEWEYVGFSPVGFRIGVMIKGNNLMYELLQA